jgi:hypothetical protein
MAPALRSSIIVAMLSMIKSAIWFAVSGSAERMRMNDGLDSRRIASSVPKSVSWETTIRPR